MPGYLAQPQIGILSKSGALTSAVSSVAGKASALLTQATSAAATGSKLAVIGTAGATVVGYALAVAGVAAVGYAVHQLVNPLPEARRRAVDADRTYPRY
jgi:hypothetical protein